MSRTAMASFGGMTVFLLVAVLLGVQGAIKVLVMVFLNGKKINF